MQEAADSSDGSVRRRSASLWRGCDTPRAASPPRPSTVATDAAAALAAESPPPLRVSPLAREACAAAAAARAVKRVSGSSLHAIGQHVSRGWSAVRLLLRRTSPSEADEVLTATCCSERATLSAPALSTVTGAVFPVASAAVKSLPELHVLRRSRRRPADARARGALRPVSRCRRPEAEQLSASEGEPQPPKPALLPVATSPEPPDDAHGPPRASDGPELAGRGGGAHDRPHADLPSPQPACRLWLTPSPPSSRPSTDRG